MNFWIGILLVIHVFVALFLIGIVLMQKSQDQGVGAAFGGKNKPLRGRST